MEQEQLDQKLENKLVWVVARVNHQLESLLSDRLKSLGLPIEQYWIMQALCENGPTAISQLAEAAHAGRPNTTKIVDRMVASGLVFRTPDPDDRRRINIVPTKEGRQVYQETVQYSSDIEQQLQTKLKAAELKTLKNLLQTIA